MKEADDIKEKAWTYRILEQQMLKLRAVVRYPLPWRASRDWPPLRREEALEIINRTDRDFSRRGIASPSMYPSVTWSAP